MLDVDTPPQPDTRQAAATEQRFAAESDRWDHIYSEHGSWVSRLWDKYTRKNVRERFRRAFEVGEPLAGKSVLDLGCGSGRYLVEAASRGAARVVGVDLAAPMIDEARRLCRSFGFEDRVELRVGDLYELELDGPFDLVIANGVFDYLPDAPRALARMRRLTGGTLVASFPDRAAFRAAPRRLYWRARGLRITLFDENEVLALARAAGFGSAAVERLGPIFLLVARTAPGRAPTTRLSAGDGTVHA
jgi:SAM-dependent methyltransferase